MMNLSPIDTPYTTTSTAALAHSATAFVPATGAASMGYITAITGAEPLDHKGEGLNLDLLLGTKFMDLLMVQDYLVLLRNKEKSHKQHNRLNQRLNKSNKPQKRLLVLVMDKLDQRQSLVLVGRINDWNWYYNPSLCHLCS